MFVANLFPKYLILTFQTASKKVGVRYIINFVQAELGRFGKVHKFNIQASSCLEGDFPGSSRQGYTMDTKLFNLITNFG